MAVQLGLKVMYTVIVNQCEVKIGIKDSKEYHLYIPHLHLC